MTELMIYQVQAVEMGYLCKFYDVTLHFATKFAAVQFVKS